MNYTKRLHPILILILGLILIIIISWLDYMTGPYLTLSLFYLFPIAVITWYGGRNYGYIAVFCSVCLVLVADLLWKSSTIHPLIPYWNTFIKMVIFIIVVIGIIRIKEAAQRESLLARTDPLTGIANTRSFFEILEYEMHKSRRYSNPFTVAYIDLDNFKNTNDRFGHLIGDEILKKIAEVIQRNIRKVDTAARLGGDEFTVLMPETTLENARPVIRRLLEVITEQAKEHEWSVTASIGLGSFNKIPDSTNSVISSVDRLMYQAKQKGKNRFEECFFSE